MAVGRLEMRRETRWRAEIGKLGEIGVLTISGGGGSRRRARWLDGRVEILEGGALRAVHNYTAQVKEGGGYLEEGQIYVKGL